mgnify:CR=1 FL=1
MILPLKDLTKEHPIPDLWKGPIEKAVKEMIKGNFEFSKAGENISLQSKNLVNLNSDNVSDYGCTLIPLLEKTWESSRTQWMGNYWEITIDLCTTEEGISDLILSGRVYPSNSDFKYEFGLVYVP